MEQYSLPLSGPGTIYLYILKLHYKYTVYNIQNILRNIHETSHEATLQSWNLELGMGGGGTED